MAWADDIEDRALLDFLGNRDDALTKRIKRIDPALLQTERYGKQGTLASAAHAEFNYIGPKVAEGAPIQGVSLYIQRMTTNWDMNTGKITTSGGSLEVSYTDGSRPIGNLFNWGRNSYHLAIWCPWYAGTPLNYDSQVNIYFDPRYWTVAGYPWIRTWGFYWPVTASHELYSVDWTIDFKG